jgi:hypothetical protein
VIRGGSWNNKPRNVRAANRNRNTPEKRNNNVGFRLASPPAGRRLFGGAPGTAAFKDAAGVVCGCP